MWVETSRTVWDETHIFMAWLASEKVQKWLKYAKICINWRLKVQKRLKESPKLALVVVQMWVETSRTVREEPRFFLALQASDKVQKWLKYAKFGIKWRLKVPKYLKNSAKPA